MDIQKLVAAMRAFVKSDLLPLPESPQQASFTQLVAMLRENSLDSARKQEAEARLEWFVKTAPDFSTLGQFHRIAYSSLWEGMINDEIRSRASRIGDLEGLVAAWRACSRVDVPQTLIKVEMFNIIGGITPDNIPPWFEKMLVGGEVSCLLLTREVRNTVWGKCNELLAVLAPGQEVPAA